MSNKNRYDNNNNNKQTEVATKMKERTRSKLVHLIHYFVSLWINYMIIFAEKLMHFKMHDNIVARLIRWPLYRILVSYINKICVCFHNCNESHLFNKKFRNSILWRWNSAIIFHQTNCENQNFNKLNSVRCSRALGHIESWDVSEKFQRNNYTSSWKLINIVIAKLRQ